MPTSTMDAFNLHLRNIKDARDRFERRLDYAILENRPDMLRNELTRIISSAELLGLLVDDLAAANELKPGAKG